MPFTLLDPSALLPFCRSALLPFRRSAFPPFRPSAVLPFCRSAVPHFCPSALLPSYAYLCFHNAFSLTTDSTNPRPLRLLFRC